jgi:hypothetical protein
MAAAALAAVRLLLIASRAARTCRLKSVISSSPELLHVAITSVPPGGAGAARQLNLMVTPSPSNTSKSAPWPGAAAGDGPGATGDGEASKVARGSCSYQQQQLNTWSPPEASMITNDLTH